MFKMTPNGPVDLTPEEEQSFLAQQQLDAQTDIIEARKSMSVSRFQAIEAIDRAGLLTQIESIMADPQTSRTVRNAWNNAQEFKRLSPTVVALGATLGLTDEQLDTLFTQAKSIEA